MACRNKFGNCADVSKGLRLLLQWQKVGRSGKGGRHSPYQYQARLLSCLAYAADVSTCYLLGLIMCTPLRKLCTCAKCKFFSSPLPAEICGILSGTWLRT